MTAENRSSQKIDGYEIIKIIGKGGMGQVYLAKQESMDRTVALKVLPRSTARRRDFKQRFFREARSAGQLNHPNIVSAFDAQECNGNCYIAMEYVEGEAVSDKIKREGMIEEDEALSIIHQIASALAHAWKANIVHRDVKPENFLYTADGVAKLCDLGIAKAPADAGLTQEGTALGTPRYIAPEQARGLPDVDWRADVYSLGASAYHMLCGQPPFDGATAPAIMLQHINEPLPPLKERAPRVSRNTAMVVEKMMTKNPAGRYKTPEDLLEDLSLLQKGAQPKNCAPRRASARRPAVRRTSGPTRVRSSRAKSNSPLPVVGGILLVGAAMAILLILSRNEGNTGGGVTMQPTPAPQPAPPAVTPEEQARRGYAEALELERNGSLQTALSAFLNVSERWPATQHGQRAAEKADAIRSQLHARQSNEVAKRNEDAARALSLLMERGRRMPEQQFIEALNQFRNEWNGTPSADQAFSHATTLQQQIAAREMEVERLREEVGGQIPRAKEVLAGDDWPRIENVLRVMERGGPAFTELVPEAETVARRAPEADLRALSLAAVAAADPRRGERLAMAQLRDRNERVRLQAVGLLAERRVRQARPILERMVNGERQDPSPDVRHAAASALQHLQGE